MQLSFKKGLMETAFMLQECDLCCALVCAADARGKCQILNCYAWVAARGGYLGKSNAANWIFLFED